MEQTFRGDVKFRLHDKPMPHRFEVSVIDDEKMIISLEDRQSKKQWRMDALAMKDYITEENVIPSIKIHDYAKKFAACLTSVDKIGQCDCALSTSGTERVLTLSLPFQWANEKLLLKYKFTLNEVALERIDLLGARLQDVEEQVSRSPIYAQARTYDRCTRGRNLLWLSRDGDAADIIAFYGTGCIGFSTAGVYAIGIGVVHSGASSGPIYSLKRSEVTLMTGYGSSKKRDFTTTPMQYTLKAKAGDKIHVVYLGTGQACASSFISIRKL